MNFKLTKLAAAVAVTATLTFSLAFAADTAATTNGAATEATAVAAPTPTAAPAADAAQGTAAPDNAAPVMQDEAKTAGSDTSSDNQPSSTSDAAKTDTSQIYAPPATTDTTPAANDTTTKAQTTAVISEEKLLEFAQKAALATFTYDYSNYQKDIQNMQMYFTQTGWASFNKALTASNNLDVVQKEKLTVNAAMNGQAEITQHQQTATGQEWQVTVPVIVTYKNDKNQQIQQHLRVKLAIATVDTNLNPNGIGINQFIAMPDGKATPAS
jgi:hypothetical protein